MFKTIIICQRCNKEFEHYKRTKGGPSKKYCDECGYKILRERQRKKAPIKEGRQ